MFNPIYSKPLKASLLIALSGILYGFLGYLGTAVLQEDIAISTMLFWRFLIAGGWMFLFLIRKHLSSHNIFHVDQSTLLSLLVLGGIGYAGSSGFYFMASEQTGTGLAMVIFFSYPIIIALSSWLIYRQPITFITLFTLVAMTVGLFLLRDTNTHDISIMGILFGIMAAACYAFYVMGSKHLASRMLDSTMLTTIVCLGCAFIFLLLSISANTFVFPTTLKAWAYLLALGVLATAIPIQLMLEGLKQVSSLRASIISVLEPLVTVLVGILLLNETVSHWQVLGVLIILTSALAVQFQRHL